MRNLASSSLLIPLESTTMVLPDSCQHRCLRPCFTFSVQLCSPRQTSYLSIWDMLESNSSYGPGGTEEWWEQILRVIGISQRGTAPGGFIERYRCRGGWLGAGVQGKTKFAAFCQPTSQGPLLSHQFPQHKRPDRAMHLIGNAALQPLQSGPGLASTISLLQLQRMGDSIRAFWFPTGLCIDCNCLQFFLFSGYTLKGHQKQPADPTVFLIPLVALVTVLQPFALPLPCSPLLCHHQWTSVVGYQCPTAHSLDMWAAQFPNPILRVCFQGPLLAHPLYVWDRVLGRNRWHTQTV